MQNDDFHVGHKKRIHLRPQCWKGTNFGGGGRTSSSHFLVLSFAPWLTSEKRLNFSGPQRPSTESQWVGRKHLHLLPNIKSQSLPQPVLGLKGSVCPDSPKGQAGKTQAVTPGVNRTE